MSKTIFVNLPVADLDASKAFYEALGFVNEPRFSDDTGACMVWSDAIFVMILTHDKWRQFTDRPIPDAGSSEVMLAIGADSREAVDAMARTAAAQGGTADINPAQDHGFMYSRAFADRDGHVWEPFWMDPAVAAGEAPAAEAAP
ncbi:MAG: lactoylglutathione lyase [Alphaproteobacteria bacterium HGW-Alphaproteobacteria-13]|jgi:predicted lactoylglutathione lyase|nr:MAG: lactoylglutathione lyase [Alphaproteobacteria bacterium HGW-Alphaproteobacteria-13]